MIGAGAVIVTDVPAWSIVVGVPGQVLKMRFDKDVTDDLERLRWWDWDEEMIKKYYSFLTSTPTVEKIRDVLEMIHV